MKKKVLFLCQGNACQSQMAEGLLRHFYGNQYEVYSAGITPKDMNKNAVDVMKEIGIDISEQTSKSINEFLNTKFDIVVTFNDMEKQEYPSFLDAVQKFDWELFNPAEKIDTQKDLLKAFREIRDDLKNKIKKQF